MREEDVMIGALLEEACLTLEQLSRACAAPPDWVIEHVREGLLPAPGDSPSAWRFSSRDLWRARRMLRIERDFDAVPELAALVADLLAELDEARERLRRAGFD
ncbi:MAG: MerR family transcriptional regulator [Burkholderiales bacterium]|nr:MAG: MerR family transcriptional regulator [Burkholderiales bacterium]